MFYTVQLFDAFDTYLCINNVVFTIDAFFNRFILMYMKKKYMNFYRFMILFNITFSDNFKYYDNRCSLKIKCSPVMEWNICELFHVLFTQKVWERNMDEQLTPDAWASIWKNKNKIINSVRLTSLLSHSLTYCCWPCSELLFHACVANRISWFYNSRL